MTDPPGRLILWDIDGTLLSAGPVAREAFDAAVADVLGRHPGDHGVTMSGKTDPQIALEIMERAGVSEGDAHRHLPAILRALERRLADGIERMRADGKVHPGVRELLARLSADPGVVQTVLTGNLESNARSKLAAFDLDRFLDLTVGAFGSDHHDRSELVPFSLRRVRERYGRDLRPRDVWVIGDTPRDLSAARAGGARCLLVGTGRIPVEELRRLGAESVVDDLSDVEEILRLLRS